MPGDILYRERDGILLADQHGLEVVAVFWTGSSGRSPRERRSKMMRGKNAAPQFKARVALGAIREKMTLAELSKE